MEPDAIHVLLEPGYDYGRTGAWVAGLPGCFAWADDRDSVLRAVPERVANFGRWLDSHGRAHPLPPTGVVVVLEEVPARWEGDEELNATFEADRRQLTLDELERGLEWLADSHADLVELLETAGILSREPGEPRVARRNRVRETDRPAAAVARHVGGAEIWMVGRLDRSLRYEGLGLDADLRSYLDATHRWAVTELAALHGRDAAAETTDRRGETWTIRKVMRRLIYHSLDHIGELERESLAPAG